MEDGSYRPLPRARFSRRRLALVAALDGADPYVMFERVARARVRGRHAGVDRAREQPDLPRVDELRRAPHYLPGDTVHVTGTGFAPSHETLMAVSLPDGTADIVGES